MTRRFLPLLSLLFIFFAAASTASAQINARIRGTVTDPQGAALPNADVVATNQATGVKFTTKATAKGDYFFAQLPVGTYTISVSSPGFKNFSASGIVLTIDQEYVEPVALTLGNASDQVQVEADAVQVNTTDMQLNNVVNSSQMVELPLIGRSFTGLELTLPGVQEPDNRFTGNYSVSGAQNQQSEYLINGADSNDIALNTIALTPNLDAIDQFNLIDGPLNAEYDRNSGGIVTATIKQGTNHFHGDAFEFYRDTFLNTNNFFQKTYNQLVTNGPYVRTDTVSPYHQNIFGGTIGGPVLKDKLFFFGAYQGTREGIPQVTNASAVVYTPAQLGGNFGTDLTGTGQAGIKTFSSNPIPSTVKIPGCTTGETWQACLGPTGGVVPTSAFNPVAAALVKQYVPTLPNGSTGYTFNATENTTADQYIGRVDYDFNPRNQITVLGIYQKQNLLETLPFSGATIPGFGDGDIEHIQQWTFDYVRQISNSLVNDLAAHYTRFNYNSGAPQQIVQPGSAGFAITPQDAANSTIPTIAVNGYFTLGGTSNGPQPRIDQVIQFDDTVSKTFGHHNLKFGYDGRRFNVSNIFDASNSGAYTFNGTGGIYSTGDPGLDFLLGIPASFSQGTGSVIQADAFLNYLYAQDTWKVTNSFTLDYGLGYSIDTPLRNHQFGGEAVSCFIVGEQSKVFPNAPANMAFPGDPGCTNSGQAYTHYTELGPRLGFAWAPDLGWISGAQGKFSVRGGFGIYFNRTEEESALQTLGTPPFGFTSSGAGDFGGSPSFTNPYADINGGLTTGPVNGAGNPTPGSANEANRFPYVEPVKGQPVTFPSTISNISSFDKTFRAPYAENFQLSIERELPSKLVARISYVGTLARHNQDTYEGNYETAAGHAACLASAACIAHATEQAFYYPSHKVGNSSQLLEEGEVGGEASSNYNSLQVGLTKSTTHGLEFQISYTYAHAMDNSSSFESSGFGGSNGRGYNQYVQSLNYGDSSYDARHHFVFAPIYTTPLIRGRSQFSPISLALSGWQVSGITTLATGLPFDISYGGYGTSNSLYCDIQTPSFYACPDIPNQVAPVKFGNPRIRNVGTAGNGSGDTYSSLFNSTPFAAEAVGTFGNIHRDPFHGPGVNNTNLILAKNFILSADGVRRIQLRMESDNVFNHTQFNNPDGNYSDGTFGEITSAAAARQTQLAGKFYF